MGWLVVFVALVLGGARGGEVPFCLLSGATRSLV